MIKIFFQLLQVAVGNREELTRQLSTDEWALLYAMCKKQSLVGIGFAGIQRLPSEQRPPLKQLAQWIHDSEKIKEKNAHQTEMCATVSQQLTHDGLWNCILKGQSNLVNYPEWLRDYRTPGDIDVWAIPFTGVQIAVSNGSSAEYVEYKGIEGTIEYSLMQARLADSPTPEIRYNHVELPSVFHSTSSGQGPVDVEIHHRPSFMNCMYRNHRFQNWCEINRDSCVTTCEIDGHSFSIATSSFNVVYQLSHIYCHLFDEGIGLRQLLDYYFVLRALHIEQVEMSDRTQSMAMWAESIGRGISSNEEIMHTLSRFGMKKFASAVMYVLQKVFAMPDEYILCPPNEKEGKFLLREIMMAGNFGRFDSRISHGGNALHHNWEKLKHNFRLIRHYPEEVLWEPIFRLYHFLWRKLELWRY